MDDLHDLLLVDHDAVGFFGESVDDGVELRNRGHAVLAFVVVGDEIHGAGAEEGVGGDEVGQAVGFHLGEELAHAA